MWSDRHFYFDIYKDKNLSSSVETKSLRAFLDTLPELKKTSDFNYRNVPNSNISIDLLILYAKSVDSWSSDDTNSKKTNLLTIVCTKRDSAVFEQHKTLLIKIASFLNWQLVDERTDDGIDDFVIWAPKTNL